MKYLLQAIEAKRASVKLGDAELRQLLTEVCKGRDEREEFLESIDRIITELKNYTEHSTAFLSKVSKRDAPDYYDVIKHPMDLGTMQKKVKSGQYKSKKQFAHDLNLIWDNCLVYNSDPTHPLRRNVQFMRKKADHLLEFISDKSDVKDALVQWGSAPVTETVVVDAMGKDRTPAPQARVAAGGKEDVRKRRRWGEARFEDQEAFVRTPQSMMDFGRIDAGLHLLETGGAAAAGPSSRPMLMAPVEAMDRIRNDAEEDDPLSAVLGSMFAPLLGDKGKEKETPEPQLPTQSQPQSRTQSQSGSTPAPTSTTVDTSSISTLDASAEWFTVTASQQLMSSALPALPSSALLPSTSPTQDSRGKKRKKPFHPVPATRRKGLQGKIARNIRTLHKVQATHNKFLSLAHFVENEAPIPAYLTSMSDEESDYPSDPEDHPSHHHQPNGISTTTMRNPLARISAESAREHAAYNVRMMLAHQGFEGGHRGAIDVLTDVLGEFMGNMGRMLRVYSDRYASTLSSEEMILHTLQECGGSDVLSLENYIRNDVERYGSKMTDLLRKLRNSYREQFNQSTERGVIEDEALFADNGEALVAGNFAEDLGDDYFGFRELGLDRELGMSGLTVPTRLFYGRARNANALAARGGAVKDNVLPYPPPPEPVRLVAAAVAEQIGLMQPFYQEKLRELRQRANTLVDEEQEKQRYKVPPTGKMPRRALWSAVLERRQLGEREREREREREVGGVGKGTVQQQVRKETAVKVGKKGGAVAA
ncbi:hypothetical protein [Sporisorium scitamineum]|uniref:Bromo domain-containing protein n=1 Tax=Sporisorium scitamineum TaxID=49012 RepID=A0A0F7S3K9_9BASI|nr:hypothetical protein [Sporisorium scitamineum]